MRLAGRDLLAMPESRLRRVRGADVGFVFQDPLTALDPAMTVGEQLVETLRCHRGIRRPAARRRAAELLELVGIPEPGAALDRFPRQFSGGMRQRVLIALAICCDPALLIADEATTALDPTVQIQILSLLRRLRRELGMALIVISHDLGVIAAVCDRVQVMYGGVVVEHGPVPQVLAAPRHPYTAGLLRLAPRFEHRTHRRLRPIPGMALTVTGTRHDCRFADRCELADDRCRTEVPPWSHTADGRHGSACWRPPTAVAALASAAPTPQEVR
ncbi:hypothetical protein BJF78_30335 [Pseudonocardia sp. CNS-139]|nr:hypothetical protein BJF78_30335 [Pseudonocardia sp. CNS-139]